MPTLTDKAREFLAQERIAVAGVSGRREDAANNIYSKLKKAGHQVFAVNPRLEEFKGEPCYPDLKSIPGGVNAVVIVTRAERTEEIVRQCPEAGVSHVWMHRMASFLGSSVSEAAIQYCREKDISVIAGACPMMFCEPVDFGHKCIRGMLGLFGRLPK